MAVERFIWIWRAVLLGTWAALGLSAHTAVAATPSVFLEEMTSPEVRDRIASGTTTVLIPIGGTEQNGPHMVLGKHNTRARLLAAQIARKLGNALVAPVVAYVPEGAVSPPAAHMRFAGTISIPDAAFEALLDGTARSFAQHGFQTIVFLGDHGGYQKNEERVATKLNRDWTPKSKARALALLDYYQVTQTDFVAELKKRGFTQAEIGTHAGLADTSLTLAVDPTLVRADLLSASRTSGKWTQADGVYGDPHRASADLGQWGVQRIVESSAQVIRAFAQNH